MIEDIGGSNCTIPHNATLFYMWYKGQRCRLTQWLVHDLRLRTIQTAGQVDTFSPESSGFFIATLLTLRTAGHGLTPAHAAPIMHTTYDLIT